MPAEPPEVTEMMQELAQRWEGENDQRAVFLNCYRMMTINMGSALQAGEFNDTAWVSAWLGRFADYYFIALDAYEHQDPQTPGAWRVAFDAAVQARCSVVQNLLLGVNAHINYDLVLAVVDLLNREWADLPPEMRQTRQADFDLVNQVIGQTTDNVQDNILERKDPRLAILDNLLGPIDEWLISHFISRWREEAWQEALRFLAVSDEDEREILRQQLEEKVKRIAEMILLEG